jgi:hypothetical protein
MTGLDGVVQIAYLHREQVSHSWVESMRGMLEYDLPHGRIARKPLNLRCGAGLVAQTRNYGAKLFLDKTDHEWLLYVDTDMGFAADSVERLLEVADPADRPIVGALCFAFMESAHDGMGGWRRTIVPTMYKMGKDSNGKPSFCYFGDYEENSVTKVAATGGAFLLIHRSVLEKLRADIGDHWFDMVYDHAGDVVGEDLAFCGRALQAGFVPVVHTGVKTTHHKEVWLQEQDYLIQAGAGSVPIALDPFDPGEADALQTGATDVERIENLMAYLRDKHEQLARVEVASVVTPVLGERVQHCNARTDYELIAHPYAPAECDECARIAEIPTRAEVKPV